MTGTGTMMTGDWSWDEGDWNGEWIGSVDDWSGDWSWYEDDWSSWPEDWSWNSQEWRNSAEVQPQSSNGAELRLSIRRIRVRPERRRLFGQQSPD